MHNKEKIEKAICLVDEMISLAAEQDKKHKVNAIARNKAEEAVGESWELFYLKNLRDLLADE
tara:strand:+ start:150 stop:335 length:186 start_codon:yes stop_codon:yes gene_type:complete